MRKILEIYREEEPNPGEEDAGIAISRRRGDVLGEGGGMTVLMRLYVLACVGLPVVVFQAAQRGWVVR